MTVREPQARPVVAVSFGYLHARPPTADLTVDVRDCLFDPHADPGMRDRTGLDAEVARSVLATPGAVELAARLADVVGVLAGLPQRRGVLGVPVTVAVGCAGGRHRSVALAEHVAGTLRGGGLAVTVEHRDVHRPVVRPAGLPG
jgi:RNase adaptor protein for sRNA GlmZ degradation